MKKSEIIKVIAGLLKLDQAKLTAAVNAEDDADIDIEIPDGLNVLTDDDLQQVKDREYANGKKNGLEMEIKDYKKNNGIEATGKTLDSLVKAVQAKALADANISPDKRVQTLEKDLEKVRGEYTQLEATIAEKDKAITGKEANLKFYQSLATLGDGHLPINKLMTLAQADGYNIGVDESGMSVVTDQAGNVIKDKMSKPVEPKAWLEQYSKDSGVYKEPKPTTPAPAGRGAGDRSADTVVTKKSELIAEFEGKGLNVNGIEFSQALSKAMENPDFDANS